MSAPFALSTQAQISAVETLQSFLEERTAAKAQVDLLERQIGDAQREVAETRAALEYLDNSIARLRETLATLGNVGGIV